ncbi:MAG: hypothetical protein K0Q97_2213 [Bacillota bacterium]|jgi:hypothetical protein|nr:hypothetical protein [Bacillota bacterium]
MYHNYYYIVNNYYQDSYIDKNVPNEDLVTYQQQLETEAPVSEVTPTITPLFETGTLSVKVLNKSGLPVKDALVTVFHFHQNGELEVHYNIRTDENGDVPEMKLSVRQSDVLLNPEYYFSYYTLRVIADNYFPVNIVNFEVFPDIKTNYVIRMDPITDNGSMVTPEKTIVIPSKPLIQPDSNIN